MPAEFRLRLNSRAVAALADTDEAMDLMQEVGEAVAEVAAGLAPRASGGLARSIHAETGRDGDGAYAHISWDDDHAYGVFHELGTEDQRARPFLRPALEQTNI